MRSFLISLLLISFLASSQLQAQSADDFTHSKSQEVHEQGIRLDQIPDFTALNKRYEEFNETKAQEPIIKAYIRSKEGGKLPTYDIVARLKEQHEKEYFPKGWKKSFERGIREGLRQAQNPLKIAPKLNYCKAGRTLVSSIPPPKNKDYAKTVLYDVLFVPKSLEFKEEWVDTIAASFVASGEYDDLVTRHLERLSINFQEKDFTPCIPHRYRIVGDRLYYIEGLEALRHYGRNHLSQEAKDAWQSFLRIAAVSSGVNSPKPITRGN